MNKTNQPKNQNVMPEITRVLKVNRSEELLSFLLSKLNTSRNNVKSLLSNRQILVNGSLITQYNFMLAKDDEIKICKKPLSSMPLKRKQSPLVNQNLEIIYEDDDFIAINKPCGLLSVESDKDRRCAYNYVLDYLQSKSKALRPYILHRIDKETSGVLVFAKNIKVHSKLKLNWNDYVLLRQYYAVVEGKMEKKEDTIVSYMFENKNNMVYSSKDHNGQRACTHYEVVCQNDEYSLLKVDISTGRKNQIRVHMQDLKHPIVGDDKYGCNKNPFKRLGLHASKLEFMHPFTKRIISIDAKVPNIFYKLFK